MADKPERCSYHFPGALRCGRHAGHAGPCSNDVLARCAQLLAGGLTCILQVGHSDPCAAYEQSPVAPTKKVTAEVRMLEAMRALNAEQRDTAVRAWLLWVRAQNNAAIERMIETVDVYFAELDRG